MNFEEEPKSNKTEDDVEEESKEESNEEFDKIKDDILKAVFEAKSVEDLLAVGEKIKLLNEIGSSENEKLESPEEIQRLKERIEELEEKVYYDELTGLLNRRGFQKEIESRFIDALNRVPEDEKRSKAVEPVNIIFADLNGFKPINDRYGHAAGDRILATISENLNKELRESDVIARIGGDEFLIAFTGNKKIHEVVKYKVKKIIEETKVSFENEELSVGVSVGGAVNDLKEDISQTIEKADTAMYQQKDESGR